MLMSESNKIKDVSPLVQSVLTLAGHFAELDRLSARIEEMELKSEFDFTQVRRLMTRFSETAEAVSTDVIDLSSQLNNSRAQAEAAAAIVAAKAEAVQARQSEQDEKLMAFKNLAEKVNALGQEMKELRRPEGEVLSEDDRTKLTFRLSELDLQLQPLIEEARVLKKEAQSSKMKVLEQNAESLTQSLMAVSQKLAAFAPSTNVQTGTLQ